MSDQVSNLCDHLRRFSKQSPNKVACYYPSEFDLVSPSLYVILFAIALKLLGIVSHVKLLMGIVALGLIVIRVAHSFLPIRFDKITYAELEDWSNINLFSKPLSDRRAIVVINPFKNMSLTLSTIMSCAKVGVQLVVVSPHEMPSLKHFVHAVRHANATTIIATPVMFVAFKLILWYYPSDDGVDLNITETVFVSDSLLFNTVYRLFKPVSYLDTNAPLFKPDVDSTLAIINTTGSTGVPKLVHITYGMLLHQLKSFGKLIEDHSVRYPSYLTKEKVCISHNIITPLILINMDHTTVITPRFPKNSPALIDCKLWYDLMHRFQPTITFASTIVLHTFFDYCCDKGLKLPQSCEIFIGGGSPVPVMLHYKLRKISNASLYATYGSTECLPIAYIYTDQIIHELDNSMGRSLVGGAALGRICDGIQADLRPIPPFSSKIPISKLWLKGTGVSPKYEFTTTDSTSKKDQSWHDTGDIGYIDQKHNFLYICGRMSHAFLLLDAETQEETFIAPVCIEQFILQHCYKWIRRCAVIGFQPVLNKGKSEQGLDYFNKVLVIIEGYNPTASNMSHKEMQDHLQNAFNDHGDQLEYYHSRLNFGFNLLFTTTLAHSKLRGGLPCDPRHNSKIERIKLTQMFLEMKKEEKTLIYQKE